MTAEVFTNNHLLFDIHFSFLPIMDHSGEYLALRCNCAHIVNNYQGLGVTQKLSFDDNGYPDCR